MTIWLIWMIAVVTYCGFLAWYHNWRGPLSDAEMAKYDSWLDQEDAGPVAVREAAREFLLSDDGKEFYMLNMLQLPRADVPHPDTDVATPPAKLLEEYSTPFMKALFRRAGHPAWLTTAKGGIVDVVGDEDHSGWQVAGFVRYRSRRDMFEMITSDMFSDTHKYKLAALERTFAFPAATRISAMAGPRVTVALALALLAAFGTIAVLA